MAVKASKSKPKTESKRPPQPEMIEVAGFGHRKGSRKATVHQMFLKSGFEVAMKEGQKMGLKQPTIRSWIGQWRRASGVASKPGPKPKAKSPAKAKAKAEQRVVA